MICPFFCMWHFGTNSAAFSALLQISLSCAFNVQFAVPLNVWQHISSRKPKWFLAQADVHMVVFKNSFLSKKYWNVGFRAYMYCADVSSRNEKKTPAFTVCDWSNNRLRMNGGIILNFTILRIHKNAVLKALQQSPSSRFCLEEGWCNTGPDQVLFCWVSLSKDRNSLSIWQLIPVLLGQIFFQLSNFNLWSSYVWLYSLLCCLALPRGVWW